MKAMERLKLVRSLRYESRLVCLLIIGRGVPPPSSQAFACSPQDTSCTAATSSSP